MAIVKKYPSRVKDIINSIEGVYTLELESMGKVFKYDAGQFLHFAVDEYDPSGQWPDSRCFSMQSAPCDEIIKITYAAKGQFTNRMQDELKVGSYVTLKLPYGDLFSQDHNKINTIFIAGGTGITPYLSLFTDASFVTYKKPILYAGFRSKDMNLYQIEFDKAQKINPELSIQLVYQDKDGFLDIEKILNENTSNSSFFISGPPIMISNFKKILISSGIPENQVLTDDWE